MNQRTPAIQENLWRHWQGAVVISMAFHGLALLGLALFSNGASLTSKASSPYMTISVVEVEAAGGDPMQQAPVSSRAAPKAGPSSQNESAKPPAADEPIVAYLKDPLGTSTASAETDHGAEAQESVAMSARSGTVHATTSFFQIAARGQRIVYILDASASMGKNRALKIACAELKTSLKKLPPTALFQIVIYNNTAQYLLPRYQNWLQPTPAILEDVSHALDEQVAEGRTVHALALRKAFLLGPDVVYFLTDADDLVEEQLNLVRRLNQGRADVHTIELVVGRRQRTEAPLAIMARENNGMHKTVTLD